MNTELAWKAALHVEDWAAENRVNAIRAVSIAGFYGNHLVSHAVASDAPGGSFHIAVSAIALAWLALCAALHVCLSRRFLPPWLPWAAVGADIVLVTLLLVISDGPKSSLLVLLPLAIATTAVRLNLALVRGATLMAALAYGAVLIHAYEYRPDWVVPRRQQVIFTLALGCAGLLAGQSVRRARRLALDFQDRAAFLASRADASQGARS